jgi:hypothetical protein
MIDFSGKILSDEKLFTRQWGGHEIRSRSFRCSAPEFIQRMPTFEFSSIVQKMERSVNNFIRKMRFFLPLQMAAVSDACTRNGEPEPSKPSTPSSHQAAADEIEK